MSGMDLSELMRQDAWRQPSIHARQVLSIYFENGEKSGMYDMTDAVKHREPSWSSSLVETVAENLLRAVPVQTLIHLHRGDFSFCSSKEIGE